MLRQGASSNSLRADQDSRQVEHRPGRGVGLPLRATNVPIRNGPDLWTSRVERPCFRRRFVGITPGWNFARPQSWAPARGPASFHPDCASRVRARSRRGKRRRAWPRQRKRLPNRDSPFAPQGWMQRFLDSIGDPSSHHFGASDNPLVHTCPAFKQSRTSWARTLWCQAFQKSACPV